MASDGPSRMKTSHHDGPLGAFSPLFEILGGCALFVASPHSNGVFCVPGPWESEQGLLYHQHSLLPPRAVRQRCLGKGRGFKRLITVNRYEMVAYYQFINSE